MQLYSAAAGGRGRVAVSAATLVLLMIIIMMMISSSSPSDDGGGDKVCFLSSSQHFKRGKLEVNETNAPIGSCVILIEKVSIRTCKRQQQTTGEVEVPIGEEDIVYVSLLHLVFLCFRRLESWEECREHPELKQIQLIVFVFPSCVHQLY